MASNYDWTKLIEPALGFGATLVNNKIQDSRVPAATKEQIALGRDTLGQRQTEFATGQQNRTNEVNRRNSINGITAPTLLHALGYRDPAQIQQMAAHISAPEQAAPLPTLGAASGSGTTGGTSYAPASTQGVSKVASAAGGMGGAALGGIVGNMIVPGLGGVIGAGIGGLGSAIGSIGAGRRTADSAVQGYENPFGADLAAISKQAETDPAGAAQRFQQSYQKYRNAVDVELAAGGNRAKVAQQSLNNQGLQQTVKTLAGQLGVQL